MTCRCKPGCKVIVKTPGHKYAPGHCNRIASIRKRASQKFKQTIASRSDEEKAMLSARLSESRKGLAPWNKGLTAETDKRVARLSRSMKRRERIGKVSAELWCNDTYFKKQKKSRLRSWLSGVRRAKARRRMTAIWSRRSDEEKKVIGTRGSRSQRRHFASDSIFRKKKIAIARQMAKKRDTKSWRAHLSASLKGRKVWNKGLHPRVATGYFGRNFWCVYQGKNGRINMRSWWEAAFARWCDAEEIRWQYEPKQFELSSGKSYTPDFLLTDYGIYIEIKGVTKNLDKIEEFKRQYPSAAWLMLTGKELKVPLTMFCKSSRNTIVKRRGN